MTLRQLPDFFYRKVCIAKRKGVSLHTHKYANMKRQIIITLFTFCAVIAFAAQPALLHSIVTGDYKPQTLAEMVAMSDAEHYAQLQDDCINVYAYKTGAKVQTLFDASTTKLLQIKDVAGFILPEEGKYLLVYNNVEKIYRHSFTADYYIFDTERNELKLLGDHIKQPVFSPNGRYIAFARENNLFVHKLDFGTEVAVTTDAQAPQPPKGGELANLNSKRILNGTADWLYEEEFGVTHLYAFSPDNKQLAFVRFDETEVPAFRWQDMLTEGYPNDLSLRYPRAGEQNAKVSVVVYDMHYKSLKTMNLGAAYEEDSYIPRIMWTNSADQLAIFVLNRNQNKLEMLLANPKSTVSKRAYYEQSKQVYVNYEQIDEWQFLADNSFIAVNETDGYRHAYLYSAAGTLIKQLTKGAFDVTDVYGYDEKTGVLYYQAVPKSQELGTKSQDLLLPTAEKVEQSASSNVLPMNRSIYSLNVKKNKTMDLTPTVGWHSAQFSSDYAYFIDNYTSLTTPNRYTLYTNAGKKVRELLNNEALLADFAALNLPQKEFFTFTTERGDKLNGWMLLPVGFDAQQQYPVLQVQYSGPNSQQVVNRWKIDWEYFLATQGIIVVCVDGRGTGARGRDFRTSTYMNLGVQEAEDQVAVAKYMQSLPYVKKDKIGIWGWSYGGFMTILSMSQPEGIFACGIAVAPVTDWRLYDSGYTERFMRRPQVNEGGYDATDLSRMADKLQGRLLLVHGLADDNVHCQNAWKYIDALVEADKQFDMQIYPDDNHFLRKRNNYKHLYDCKWEFVQKWLLE